MSVDYCALRVLAVIHNGGAALLLLLAMLNYKIRLANLIPVATRLSPAFFARRWQ